MVTKSLNDSQERAVQELEWAFQKCLEVGLIFVGMDDALLVFDKDGLMEAGWQSDPTLAMNRRGQGIPVNTRQTYLDSGGW